MFHPQVIARNIARVEAAEAKSGRTIHVIEHSPDECFKVYDHFLRMEQGDGRKKFYRRTPVEPDGAFQYEAWEADWIRNEMFMCACNFAYFFYRYFFLKTKEGQIKRPDVYVSHQIFLDILSELDLQALPILLFILKARQLGISTIVEAIILWIALFRRGSHTVISSAEEEKSEDMSNMIWIGLENLPLWMRPTLTRDDRKKGPEFGLIDSDIQIQHGAMTKGISRGSTPIAAHLSECAYYPDPVATIESSLIRAMHENPRTFLALESTARKKGDWWHRTWIRNREGESTGYNRFTCIFLPWYVGRDKYPTADFMRNHPIPREWTPKKETLKQASDAALYVSTTPLLKKYLGKGWKMPLEQMWFWEFNYMEAIREDETLKAFLAEMASDERSCFQTKKWSVYNFAVLDRISKNIEKVKFKDYAVTGDGIANKFSLKDFQSKSGNRIDIQWETSSGKYRNWKLVPLHVTPEDDEELQFWLRVWEPPRPGFDYVIGIDVSGGVGQDKSSFDVLRYDPKRPMLPHVQVAQIYSPWISSPECPPFAAALGRWYGQHMAPVPEALMCPEVQVATGDPISYQLSNDGYTNFYYMKRFDVRKHPGQKPTRRGWASLSWSRQMMLENEKQAIDAGWIVINSAYTHFELSNMEADMTDTDKTRYDHASGENNDSVTATGIAYFCSIDEQTIMDRIQGKIKPKNLDELEAERKRDISTMDSTEAMLARHFQLEEREELGLDEEDPETFSQGQYSY